MGHTAGRDSLHPVRARLLESAVAVRLALLTLLAACWTAQDVEPEYPRPTKRVVKTRPGCWTQHFYEDWPTYLSHEKVYAECRAEWEIAPEQIDACVATRYHYGYEDWVAWTQRWWEACAGE